MHFFMFVFVAFLFFILTPGVVLSLPPKSSKLIVAMTHAIIFAIIWTIIHKSVWDWGVANGWIAGGHRYNKTIMEGMTLQKCQDKNGTYKDGYCYDTNGTQIS